MKSAYQLYLADKNYIFTLIKNRNFAIIEQLIDENKIDPNTTDGVGNNVVMRLLKTKQYSLVIKLMKKKNWEVNKQNDEGNTFSHILAQDNSIGAIKVMDELKKKSNYLPNIKNYKGETALDKAINNNYLAYAFKILEDSRFDCIDENSFKHLFIICMDKNYGKYSKISNLEIIIENLGNKCLSETLRNIIEELRRNFNLIKKEILNNNSYILKSIVGI